MKNIILPILCIVTLVAHAQPTVSAVSPSSQTICAGSAATFGVTATGAAPITYQWWVSTDNGATWAKVSNSSPYSGATTAVLAISNAPATYTGYRYHCIVSNSQGTATSGDGVLTVNPSPPAQLSNQSIVQCSSALTGSASAANPSYNYQWQQSTDAGATWNNTVDGSTYTGSQTYSLTWNLATSMNGYEFRFVITDPTTGCSLTSPGVDTLYVIGTPSSLAISPASANICPGTTTTFSISDSTDVTYQWQVSTNNGVSWTNTTDGSLYSGSTANALTITGATTAARYHVYRSVTEYGLTCTNLSNFAPLAIKTVASIATQPANDTVCAGTNATFKITGAGTSPFTYQWQTDNGTNPSVWSNVGTSLATLTLSSVPTSMDGYHYQVLFQGACGAQLTSQEVVLHVRSSGTWLGTTNNAWEVASNWCGGVPVQTTNVLVPATAPNQPTISAATGTAYSTALAINTGAVLTISGGSTSMYGPFSILGTVAYTAAGNQNILPADHGSLTIGGSGTKTLQTNTGISNTLTLGGTATLVTGSNLLTMYAGSNPISGPTFGATATSFIVTGNGSSGSGNTGLGGLKIAQLSSATGNVLFPIGPTPASYTPAVLTNGGATNDFTIAVNDQNIPGGPANAIVDHTWLISAANAGANNVTLGLQWNATDELSLFNRASAALIRSNGSNIVQESITGAAGGSNPYSLSMGNFATLTQFSAATSTMVPLAVQVISFNGSWLDNNTVGLTWTTAADVTLRSFIVQHSTDGVNFDNIATVLAGQGVTSYSFADMHPRAGSNSYRLQIVASDGDITYSRIVELADASASDHAVLAPSVTASGAADLIITMTRGSDMQYVLTDISGHILSQYATWLGKGQHTLALDLGHLPGGLYFVRITTGDGLNKVLTLVKK